MIKLERFSGFSAEQSERTLVWLFARICRQWRKREERRTFEGEELDLATLVGKRPSLALVAAAIAARAVWDPDDAFPIFADDLISIRAVEVVLAGAVQASAASELLRMSHYQALRWGGEVGWVMAQWQNFV